MIVHPGAFAIAAKGHAARAIAVVGAAVVVIAVKGHTDVIARPLLLLVLLLLLLLIKLLPLCFPFQFYVVVMDLPKLSLVRTMNCSLQVVKRLPVILIIYH